MNPSDLPRIEHALTHALTQLDAKQSRRPHYNRNALGIYFQRKDDIMADLRAGADLRAALTAGLTGSTLAACLRAVGLPKASDDEWSGRTNGGAWHYVPASEA